MYYNISKRREEKIADNEFNHIMRATNSSPDDYRFIFADDFLSHFAGALNHQTTHHLFPGVSQIYYPEITPIVRETCKEFGVRYNYKDTFFQALGSHIGHLKRLGQQNQEHKFTSSRND